MTDAPRPRLAALALPLTLVLAACGGGGEDTSTPSSDPGTISTAARGAVSITVSGGSVQGPSRHAVEFGDRVVLRVTSDVVDEVHVHGYDERAAAGPGKVAEVSFVADIPGVFEVELEQAHRRLTTLEVRP